MNRNIFVSHSNKYIDVTTYFAEFLKSRGLIPIVTEFMPNEGRLWSVNEKVEYCMSMCDSAVFIATPDESQDGKPVPRMDVIVELGLLKNSKKTIVLKENTTTLPKSVDPIYIPFDMNNLSGCLDRLDIELESMFGKIERRPFSIRKITDQRQPTSIVDEKPRETANETLLLNAAVFCVSETYAEMVYRGVIPAGNLQALYENLRRTLRANQALSHQIENSKVGRGVKALLGTDGKRKASSVWPAGYAYSSFVVGDNEPIGALLTRSTCDLIFVINGSEFAAVNSQIGSELLGKLYDDFDTIAIYLPPGFKVNGGTTSVFSTIPNGHTRIMYNSMQDQYGPGYTVVYVSGDITASKDSGLSRTSRHPFIDLAPGKECHYIRIKGMTMPSVAGKYFFKIAFLNIATMNDLNAQREQVLRFISVEDWPLILIFGEVNPAVITGIVRYAGYNQTLFNRPIQESGKVLARMTMRLDPYTGKSRPDLPLVDAAGYFSATAQGYYKIQGLAPGLYDLYASAAGYPQTLIASGVTVLRGQSLHFDGYLQPGWVIHGNVFSKGQSGDTPWAENAPVKIELYDGPTLDHIPDRRANRVSWSSSQPIAGALQNARGTVRGPQDVGPPQHWFVQGGTTTTFHYEFGVKGEYGAPRDLDGMVPQVYATWVNGLTPGRHYARAWVSGYNQSADDGSTFLEHYFDVKPDEWAGEVTLTINLRRRGIDST